MGKLAFLNVKGKKFKYIVMFIMLFCTYAGIYVGDILLESMKIGLKTTQERIGADIIVVPEGFVSEVDDALFKGKACTLSFERTWEDRLQEMEGVKETSSQLYLASLGGAACCDGEIQLIAVDIKNDFSIGPWIEKRGINNLGQNEIILGSSFRSKVGDIVKYYNKNFRVKAILSQTGGGYDKSAFISFGAAYKMALDKRNRHVYLFDGTKDLASTILIQVKDGVDPMVVKNKIEKKYKTHGIAVYSVSSRINEFADKLGQFQIFGRVMNVWITIIVGIALFAVITITTFQRKNEIGSMLTVGIPKKKIIQIFLLEYSMVSMVAIILSLLLISLLTCFFQDWIKNVFALPFILISAADILNLLLKVIIINGVIVIVSSINSFYWIYKSNPADMIKVVSG